MLRLLALAFLTTLAACTSNKGRPGTVVHTTLKQSQNVTVQGERFIVGVNPNRTFAIVGAKSGKPQVTPLMLEAAAMQVSGCDASFAPGVLAFVSGYSKSMTFRMPSPARVNLSC